MADVFIPAGVGGFSMVSIKLKELTDTLHLLIDKFCAVNQPQASDLFLGKAANLFEEIDERTIYTRRLRDRNIYTPEQVLEELAVPMVYKLIQELEDGFNTTPVLQAFSVFKKCRLPDTVLGLTDYGNRSPKTDFLQDFLDDNILRATFPSMFQLVLLSRLIPSSTASVERAFSLINLLCTDTRNRLSQQTLCALMRMCFEGDSCLTQQQKHTIVQNFKNMRQREIAL